MGWKAAALVRPFRRVSVPLWTYGNECMKRAKSRIARNIGIHADIPAQPGLVNREVRLKIAHCMA